MDRRESERKRRSLAGTVEELPVSEFAAGSNRDVSRSDTTQRECGLGRVGWEATGSKRCRTPADGWSRVACHARSRAYSLTARWTASWRTARSRIVVS